MFVVGDVSAGSVKRVASAAGEGSVLIAEIHQHLAAQSEPVLIHPNRREDYPGTMHDLMSPGWRKQFHVSSWIFAATVPWSRALIIAHQFNKEEGKMPDVIRTVLVIGATGPIAGLVPGALVGRGIKVRALVQSPAKAEVLKQQGLEDIAIGDLRDLASLDRAAKGVDGVFHIGPAFLADEAQLGLNMVEVAKRAGARRFVFSSVIQPTSSRLSNHASKIPVEDAIYASGMEYVVLQPANLFQNIGNAWRSVVQNGSFGEPFSKRARIGRVDYRDVAEVIGIAFAEDRLTYGTFELCAGLMNREEIVAVISDVLHRRIEATEPSFEEWAAAAGIPAEEDQRQGMKKLDDYYGKSPLGGNSLVLQAIRQQKPTSLRQYIESLAR
jgi:uncharacterized protein YbjT (DUF2867 family)